MEREIVISGVGGQGIQVAGQLLGCAAVATGLHAMYFSKFDGAQRGGVSDCIVAIGDEPVSAAPVLDQPIVGAIAMHPNSFQRYERNIKRGGLLLYNSSVKLGSAQEHTVGVGMAIAADTVIEAKTARTDIGVVYIPASEIAHRDLGSPLMATLVIVGAFIELTGIVPLAVLEEALKEAIRPGRHKFIPVSLKALHRGAEYARREAQVQNPGAVRLFNGRVPAVS